MIWGQDDLLTQAMEVFLTSEATHEWQVIRASAEGCVASLVEQIRKTQPALLIIYQPKPNDASDPLLKLLADQPELKVITVSLEDNVMQVYCKHSVTIRQVSDLLSVIESGSCSTNPAGIPELFSDLHNELG